MAGKDLASRLRDSVTLQQPNLVDNGRGGRKPPPGEDKWADVTPLWAECIQLRGGEAQRDAVERSIATWRVTIRVREGVTTTHRFVWQHPMLGTLYLNIRSIGLNEERDGLVMTCTSGDVG